MIIVSNIEKYLFKNPPLGRSSHLHQIFLASSKTLVRGVKDPVHHREVALAILHKVNLTQIQVVALAH